MAKTPTKAEYQALSVAALKRECKARKFKGYSRLNEDSLIEKLLVDDARAAVDAPEVDIEGSMPFVASKPPAGDLVAVVVANKRINVIVRGRTHRMFEGTIYRGELGGILLRDHAEHVDKQEG